MSYIERMPEDEVMDLPEEAEAYAEADFAEVNEAFVERLVELTPGLDSAVALDLGAGPADIPARLVTRRPGWRVVASDAARPMLALARHVVRGQGLEHAVRPCRCDAKRLPFQDASFDVIFTNSILHHITDTERLWSEIRRVAKAGGSLFLRDLSRPQDEAAARLLVEEHAGAESGLLQEEFYRSLLSAYTPAEVRAQLAAAGCEGMTVEQVTDRHLDVYGLIGK